MTTYTVREANSLTGHQAFRGDFETVEQAETYIATRAPKTRRFVSFEVWIKKPGLRPVDGPQKLTFGTV